MARAFRRATAAGIRGVVAFSDPVPRLYLGHVLSPGHLGLVYQGGNAAYLGRATARTLTLLPDGTVLPARAAAKITGQEPGWRGAAARLIDLGAPPPGESQSPAQWLRKALTAIGATGLRHPGNHRYAWRLGRSSASQLGMPSWPYPKTSAMPSTAEPLPELKPVAGVGATVDHDEHSRPRAE